MSKRPRDTHPPSSRFVADEKDIECPVCLDPCWNPTRADPCGHVACLACLDRLHECPKCRAEVLSTTPCGTAMTRRCHSARMSCLSCPWKGSRKQQVTQAHVMCPDRCMVLAGEKLTVVMRDVYPGADVKRRNLLDALSKDPPVFDFDGFDVAVDNPFFVEQMIDAYCPNLDAYMHDSDDEGDAVDDARDAIVTDWAGDRHAVIQSLSGPSSCLLWTLLDACGSKDTELAVGLALHALTIPPASPDAFPVGLDWQYVCLLVAMHTNRTTMRELLRNGLTVPNPLLVSDHQRVRSLFCCPVEFGDFECLRLLVQNCSFIDLKAAGFVADILMAAVRRRRCRWIKQLVLEFGCDVNGVHTDPDGITSYPLLRAIERNDANCMSS